MKRGDLVVAVAQGDHGKPRPMLVIQGDTFDTEMVTLLPLTSALVEAPLFRVRVESSGTTGISLPSQVMIDRCITIRRSKVGKIIGQIDDRTMRSVSGLLAVFLGIAI